MKKFFTNFRAAVDSFPLGEQKTGFMKPGRYNGYDKIETNGALNITIGHLGILKKTGVDNQFMPNFGAIMFPSGQILHDDDQAINLVIESNSGNGNKRYDLVIAEHTYQQVSGGTPVYYSIVKGPSNGTIPVLPNPQKQVLIGIVEINANGFQYSDLKYTPERAPLPGDLSYQVLSTYINQVVNIPDANETQKGISARATQTQTNLGQDDERHITPLKLENKRANETSFGLVIKSTDNDILIGDNDSKYVTPRQVRGKGLKVSLTANYTLTPQDHGKIFINNSGNPITITVPTGLGTNVHFGFISALNNIMIAGTTGVTIKTPPNKLPETKSLNVSMLLESNSVQNEYFLLGSLKNQ